MATKKDPAATTKDSTTKSKRQPQPDPSVFPISAPYEAGAPAFRSGGKPAPGVTVEGGEGSAPAGGDVKETDD